MASAGWYPDPAGTKGLYRYWDGSGWTNQTSSDPSAQVPGPTKPAKGNGVVGVAIAGGVILVLLALVLWIVLGQARNPSQKFLPVPEDTNTSTPSISGWDETSSPTPPPTIQVSLEDCPITEDDSSTQQGFGVLRGGGLEVDTISGWRNQYMYLQWVSDLHSVADTVRPGWISNVGVGQLNAEDGFSDLKTSALQTMQCFSSSGYYENFVERIDVVDTATTIDGHSAWRMTSEVRISSPAMPEIEGDMVDIIVVDIGDPNRLGVYISSVTIGDTARQEKVDAAVATLRVV